MLVRRKEEGKPLSPRGCHRVTNLVLALNILCPLFVTVTKKQVHLIFFAVDLLPHGSFICLPTSHLIADSSSPDKGIIMKTNEITHLDYLKGRIDVQYCDFQRFTTTKAKLYTPKGWQWREEETSQ